MHGLQRNIFIFIGSGNIVTHSSTGDIVTHPLSDDIVTHPSTSDIVAHPSTSAFSTADIGGAVGGVIVVLLVGVVITTVIICAMAVRVKRASRLEHRTQENGKRMWLLQAYISHMQCTPLTVDSG